MSAGVGPGGTVTVEGPAVTFGAGTGEARAAPAPAKRCRMVCVASGCMRFGNTRCVAPHRADDPVLQTDPPGSPDEHYHRDWEEVGNKGCKWRELPAWARDE